MQKKTRENGTAINIICMENYEGFLILQARQESGDEFFFVFSENTEQKLENHDSDSVPDRESANTL